MERRALTNYCFLSYLCSKPQKPKIEHNPRPVDLDNSFSLLRKVFCSHQKKYLNAESLLLCLTLILFVRSNLVEAQVTQEWTQRYNGPGNGFDEARSIAVDDSANVYVTGYHFLSATNTDFVTIKYNSSGVQQWIRAYNGPGNGIDYAMKIFVDFSSNVYVTGPSEGIGTGPDYVLIKYNSSGIQQWVARYNGPGNTSDNAYSVTADAFGNVYLTGASSSSGNFFDIATVKYNSAGFQQWVQRYNGTANDNDGARSIAVDNSGNVYVAGWSTVQSVTYDYVTIKYNSSGLQQWVRTYNGVGGLDDVITSMAIDSSGNVFVTGKSYINGPANNDYVTIKYNSFGIQQWLQSYAGPGNWIDEAHALVLDDSCNVYVTGESFGIGTGIDYATVKYDSNGIQQWVQRYAGPGTYGNDQAYSVAVDVLGNVYVTGGSEGIGTAYDYVTLKYSASGQQQWLQRYNGTGGEVDIAHSLALDGSGNIYLAGGSEGIGTDSDILTIRYSQFVGINPGLSVVRLTAVLYDNYPNPFNPVTKIKIDVSSILTLSGAKGLVRLTVYDILGREIETLVNEELKPGTYEVEWDGTNYPSGVYYYELRAGDFIETKKMILIK